MGTWDTTDSRRRKLLGRVLTFVGLGLLFAAAVIVAAMAISRTGLSWG